MRGDALRAILDVDPSGVALISNDDLTVQLANRAFRAAMPAPDEDPVGRSVEQIWPTDAGLELRASLERVRASGEPVRLERLDVAGPDGAARRFAYHAQPLPDREDPAILLVLWETTEVELARSQAERSRERAELIADLAAELNGGAGLDAVLRTALTRAAALLGAEDASIWLLDGDGHTLVGAAELRSRGRLRARRDLAEHSIPAEVLRTLAARLLRRDQADPAALRSMEEHGVTTTLIVPLAQERRPIGILFLNYGADAFLPTAHDFAFAEAIAVQCSLAVGRARVFEAERAARARAEAAEREARRAERLQERLAAVLGHDLRTPLQVMALGVEVLQRRDALTEADRKTLSRMATSAANMQRLVADLLDFARVRAGDRIPVEYHPVRLDDVARAASLELEAARGSGADIALEGDALLEGDAARLGQLASNLIAHALRSAPAGSRPRVVVHGLPGEVALHVDAEGLVLGPGGAAKLFEPFANASGDPLHGALNLGLFIVREIARAHGGDVAVEARPRSTRFTVRLPRWRADGEEEEAARSVVDASGDADGDEPALALPHP